jgi:hypothetical protein
MTASRRELFLQFAASSVTLARPAGVPLMTSTALTHFLAAATQATCTMPIGASSRAQASLRGSGPTLAWRCVR